MLRVAGRCYKNCSCSIIDWFQTTNNEMNMTKHILPYASKWGISINSFIHLQHLPWDICFLRSANLGRIVTNSFNKISKSKIADYCGRWLFYSLDYFEGTCIVINMTKQNILALIYIFCTNYGGNNANLMIYVPTFHGALLRSEMHMR